jgi:ubiquinone/menaquinone biosynthesis C-methylase UbiE
MAFPGCAMLPRVLEPEVMDTAEEARDYDAMDHRHVNQCFVADFLAFRPSSLHALDLGTGTAQIPIELCRQSPGVHVVAVDAARHMIDLANANVRRAGFADRIRLELGDAKKLPFADLLFDAVVSNSIVHHIPRPASVVAEMVRVAGHGAAIFVRDLARPADDATLHRFVQQYAAGANDHQRQMFAESLRAALTAPEMGALVAALGFPAAGVQMTSDRHWTWAAIKP